MSSKPITLVVVALLAISGFSPVRAEAAVSDDFSAANLDVSLWSFVDPVGDSTLSQNNGELKIVAAAGTSHNVWTDGNFAPRVMQPTDNSDFEIEAKFSSVPSVGVQMQGVLVEQDAANFLRFDVYFDGKKLKIFAATFVEGSPTVQLKEDASLCTQGCFLRLARSGDSWDLSASGDGLTWNTAASFNFPLSVSSVGVFSGNAGGSPPEFTASVDYFFNTASPISPEDGQVGDTDLTGPALLSPSLVAISDTEVSVQWRTDEPADGRVEYGLTTAYELGSVSDSQLKSDHSFVVSGLVPENSYVFRIVSADAAGNTTFSEPYTVDMSARPVIDVWYGDNQKFGNIGQPQWGVNLLGNVSDPDGISSFQYSLNGGPFQSTPPLGPDNKRLHAPGDFNIELDFSEFVAGPNVIELLAVDSVGLEARESVTIQYPGRAYWPVEYVADWSSSSDIQDIAQVIDGKWEIDSTGLRPVELGYDRLVGIGDTTWTNYEAVVPLTVNSFDPICAAGGDCAGVGPLVGLLARWPGHTFWGSFPNHGWYPMGAFAAFRWNGAGDPVDLAMFRGSDGQLAAQDKGKTLAIGAPYLMKIRAETISSAHRYSVKLWSQDQAEPLDWDLSIDEPLPETASGSLLLVAHHVDVSFGDVAVSTLGGGSAGDVVPPVVSNIQVSSISETSATITWDTDEAASSIVAYGQTSLYEDGTLSDGALVTSHSVTLAGLIAGSEYHYQVRSTDAAGNASSSGDLTFTTSSSTGGGGGSGGTVTDNFDGSLDTTVWSFSDPLGDSSFSMTGTQLTISVPAGTSHNLWRKSNHAPRIVRTVADNDFEVTVKFDSAVTEKYQMQGIVAEQDGNNLVRFDFLSDGSGTRLFAATFSGGKPDAKTNFAIADGTPLYMRIRREGNLWAQSYSYDGVNWLPGASFTHALNVATVGVFAGNHDPNGSAPAHTAVVDYFTISGAGLSTEPDTAAPLISQVNVSVTDTTATATWVTDEPSSSELSYGFTLAHELGTVADSSLVTSHNLSLTGLTPDSQYLFEIRSADESGNQTTVSNLSFETDPQPVVDTDAPAISNIQVISISETSATITWQTDEAATSQVAYGLTSLYENGTVASGELASSHSLTLTGLTAGTEYHYQIRSTDASGNTSSSSDLTFTSSDLTSGNSAPSTTDDNYATEVNTVLTADAATGVLANDNDPDGDVLEAILVDDVRHGTLMLNADGSFSYTPDLGFVGADNFTYRASDGSLNSSLATVALSVTNTNGANLPPVVTDDSYVTGVDATLMVGVSTGVLANDSDPDNGTLSAVLVSDVTSGSLTLNSDGSFSYSPTAGFTGSDTFTYRANDGDLDSEIASVTISVGVVVPNQPPRIVSGQPSFEKRIIGFGVRETHSVVAADFDSDGDVDVAATNYLDDRVTLFDNDGSGGFVESTLDSNLDGAYPSHVADLDQDGDPDILAGGYLADTLVWYENDGVGVFTRRIIDSFADGIHSMVTGDLDADGDLDLVTTNQDAGSVSWYENDGFESFTRRDIDLAATGAKHAVIADIDGDGDQDIASASYFADEIAWHDNDGSQNFTKKTIDGSANGAYYVDTLDADGDGDIDLVTASRLDNTIAFYRNGGSGQFTKTVLDSGASGARTVIVADLDEDGDEDAIAASVDDDTVAWFENDGAGNFAYRVIDLGADGAYGLFATDMDGDGDTDVLSASRDADAVAIHRQTRAHTAALPIAGTITIDSTLLRTEDPDDGAGEISYVLTAAPILGDLLINGVAATVGDSFSQQDVEEGSVTYIHTSTGTGLDQFSFTVADGGEGGVSPADGSFALTIGDVTDQFDGSLDTTVWSFSDPLGDSSFSMTGTQLAISVPAGTSHNLWRNSNHAPRIVRNVTDSDFEVTVKFDSAVTEKYQMQGIIAEQDDGNLVRFDFLSDGSGTRLFAATFSSGTADARSNFAIADGTPLYMRIRREGDLWIQSYSYDGINWLPGTSFTYTLSVGTVGVFAGNHDPKGSAPAHTALVDYFILTSL